jgi:hypothetical protein
MTDRELLELAAKAAGIPLEFRVGFMDLESPGYSEDGTGRMGSWVRWNPLTDDGDALRLAVKVHIDFKAFETTVRTWVGDPVAQRVIASVEELCGTDPYAATRRAIVRAAAEVGREA